MKTVYSFKSGSSVGYIAGRVFEGDQERAETDGLRDHTRCAVYYPSFGLSGPAWVLSCEETRETEGEAVLWVAGAGSGKR